MLKAQERDDSDIASVKKEDVRSDERVEMLDCIALCSESPEDSGDEYDWENVTEQIRADPSLAKVAVEGILPLHALSGAGAPLHTIKLLLEIYPEAAQAKCGKGYLPLFYHLALITESPSEEIVSALLEAYPGAAAATDPNNQLPIHLACQAKGVSGKIFTMLLKAHPKGAYAKDNDGNFPVDYANANKDTAAKKIALASLLSNDPEEFQKRYVDTVPKDEIKVALKQGQEMALKLARSQGSLISGSSLAGSAKSRVSSVRD
eukprot:scaffold29034_cov137-Skeletonema_menzelii.AAC.1